MGARQGNRAGDTPARWLTLGGLAVALVLIGLSDGFYHDDDVSHYLFARSAWQDARAMWHVWARPGYNIPAMVVAHFFGVFGCRVFSALQTAATAYLAYLIARRLLNNGGPGGRVAAWAPALVWAQPLVMTLAETTLTETPAALYLTAAIWLHLSGRRLLGCAAVSLLFVTRSETMGLAPVWAGAVVYQALRESGWRLGRAARSAGLWGCAGAMAWAPVAWIVAAELAHVPRHASPLGIFARQYTDAYGQGGWHHFLVGWLEASSGGIVVFAVAGIVFLGRRAGLTAWMTLGLIALHTVVFRFGLFASGGYARFLLPAGGCIAVLAAAGLGAVWQGRRRPTIAAGITLGVGWAVALAHAWPYLPRFGLTWLRVFGLAAGAGATLFGAAVCAIAGFSRHRRAAARVGAMTAGVALALAGAQIGVQVRPLRLSASTMHPAVVDAVRVAAAMGHADDDAITTHVLVSLLRDNVTIVFDVADAEDRWRRAAPGVLFFWDSNYGCRPTDKDPRSSPLYASLQRLGRSVCRCGSGEGWSEVFVRLPDVPTTAAFD